MQNLHSKCMTVISHAIHLFDLCSDFVRFLLYHFEVRLWNKLTFKNYCLI